MSSIVGDYMKTLIYADNAATTKLDNEAFEAMTSYLLNEYGNASQPYSFARAPKAALAKARETIAKCIGALPEEIYFTSGATEANNWAIKGIVSASPVKRILVSAIEHPSITESARWLTENGVEVEYQAKGQQPSSHSADGRSMHRHLPPHVYHCANHLHAERRHEYSGDGMGRMAKIEQVEASEIAQYRDDVGHHSALAHTQLDGRPAVIGAIKVYHSCGQKHREEPHQTHNNEYVV